MRPGGTGAERLAGYVGLPMRMGARDAEVDPMGAMEGDLRQGAAGGGFWPLFFLDEGVMSEATSLPLAEIHSEDPTVAPG